jgi:hypothetical protein
MLKTLFCLVVFTVIFTTCFAENDESKYQLVYNGIVERLVRDPRYNDFRPCDNKVRTIYKNNKEDYHVKDTCINDDEVAKYYSPPKEIIINKNKPTLYDICFIMFMMVAFSLAIGISFIYCLK